MSEQPNDKISPTPAEPAKLDAGSASAALELAVTTAEKASGQQLKVDERKAPSSVQKAQALLKRGQPLLQKAQALLNRGQPLLQKAQAVGRSITRNHLAQVAAITLAVALGWAGGSQTLSGARQAHAEAAGSGIRQDQEGISRQTGDMQALKGTIDSLKASVEQAKIDAAAQNRSLLERIETVERAGQDVNAKIVRVAEVTQGIERAGAAIETKLAAINGRLDTTERQAAPAAKPAPDAGADPAQTGSVPDAKAAAAKSTPIEGWVLREVYDGGALVEGRNGRLHEVAPGRTLPSVGRIQAIERRGRIWVVVTAKGIIAPPERWR